MEQQATPLTALGPAEARTAAAVFERLLPADEHGPAAPDIGVVAYLDRALAGAYQDQAGSYRSGLRALDGAARAAHGAAFADCSADQRDELLAALEAGTLPGLVTPPQQAFFQTLRAHLQEGLFADPAHGGNRDALGWRLLGHPGFWEENSAEEHLAAEPVTKGGRIRTLADAGFSVGGGGSGGAQTGGGVWGEPEVPLGYDPHAGVRPPAGPVDVVLVGVGAMGSLVAPLLAGAGLSVVGLEAGPWRTSRDFIPDELSSAYYCRGEMGRKFLAETPRWRRDEGGPTRPATFSLGRMMNSVGGSVIHWGGALRRNHPHHFAYRSHLRDTGGDRALPEGHTLVDWPLGYADLEAHYAEVERIVGVAGDGAANPFVPRSGPLPLPPVRPFRTGELFTRATRALGLHPYPTPVAINTEPYNGRPATRYCAWTGGFGPFFDDRWYPGHTSVPEALATGNFDLRTGCRVTKVLTDAAGHADGVEYVAADGTFHVQRARTVILCSYTFENVRMLLLSGTTRHPNGLGNDNGQVGKHFMTKMWADVYGHFPGTVFNAHTGPSAQMCGLDDYVAPGFDAAAHGFVGGATPNVENQRLPIQISREGIPPDVRSWGLPYKDHLRRWQEIAAVRLQPDSLSYRTDFLDLDPRHRDRSGLGLPVVRITCDLRENERRLADFMEGVGEDILREMGAATTWRGVRFRGVCSSHDLGGARMGTDPATSVVDPALAVHDTPSLYVFGGAVFPTCHGVNPTLTMWALCHRAAGQLVERLRHA